MDNYQTNHAHYTSESVQTTNLWFNDVTKVLVCTNQNECIPSFHSEGACGADLTVSIETTINPESTAKVDTGVSVMIPIGYVGLVMLRSSLGLQGLTLANGVGVIDTDYRGVIQVCLTNNTTAPITFQKGTRIAQLLIIPCITPVFTNVTKLDITNRNTKGFGSTGV